MPGAKFFYWVFLDPFFYSLLTTKFPLSAPEKTVRRCVGQRSHVNPIKQWEAKCPTVLTERTGRASMEVTWRHL